MLVSLLLLSRSPSAVGWLIVAIGIDSIYGMFVGRARSHILEERLERLKPAFTNSDPSTSIIGPLLRISVVVTPNLHAHPSFVLRSAGFVWRLSMCGDAQYSKAAT